MEIFFFWFLKLHIFKTKTICFWPSLKDVWDRNL